MYQAGLVLEGGGMRGVYTAGVLDFFLEQDWEFVSCYGVSAGSCHMCSYLSKQPRRAFEVSVDYLQDKRYCSVYSLLTTGNLFGEKMCYDDIPNRLNPYDYEAFDRYSGNAYAVATNMKTGKAEYIKIKDMHQDIKAIQASSSLPLVSRNVVIGGEMYLDGGMADSIPILRSIADGNTKNVVVLTKETEYRRKPSSQMGLIKLRYRKYPKLIEAMENRHFEYNKTLDYLEEGVKNGTVFLIRPKQKSEVGRIEKNREKLEALYQEGYRDAKECREQLQKYLEA